MTKVWEHRRFMRNCADCKQEFIQPIGEQSWLCPICDEKEKKETAKQRLAFVPTWPTIRSIEALPMAGGDIRVQIKVKRPSDRVEFMDFSFEVYFQQGGAARDLCRSFWGLAELVYARCIDDVKYSYKCPNCGVIFFNYTNRKKKYCTPRCQNTAGVRRGRESKKAIKDDGPSAKKVKLKVNLGEDL